MKKVKISILSLALVLFFSSSSWATIKCFTHKVKHGETLSYLAERYTQNPQAKKFLIRKGSGRTEWITLNNPPQVGETLYVVKSRIVGIKQETQKRKRKVRKVPQKTVKKSTEGNSIAQKKKGELKTKKSVSNDNLEIKTDFKKGLKNWSGNFGYYHYRDWNGGSKDNKERGGHGVHGSLTFFPWNVKKWDLGPKFRFKKGVSSSNENEYKYKGLELGLRGEKKLSKGEKVGLEFGISKQNVHKAGTSQEQDTWGVNFRSDYENKLRRQQGKLWFPKYYISSHYLHQLKADVSGGAEEYDESSLQFRGRIAVYDFFYNSLRISPQLNLLAGYKWGKDSAVVGGGPGIIIGDKDSDFVEIQFLNPVLYLNDPGASRIKDFGITLKPDDIWRSSKATLVKKHNGHQDNDHTSPAIEGR